MSHPNHDQGKQLKGSPVLQDVEYVPFPSLPSSVQEPVAGEIIQHQFSPSQAGPREITSHLINAAWALVAGRQTGSHNVLFGVALRKSGHLAKEDKANSQAIATATMRIALQGDQSISDYLGETEQHLETFQTPLSAQEAFQTIFVHRHNTQDAGSPNLIWQTGGLWQFINSYPLIFESQFGDNVTIRANFDPSVIKSWEMRTLLQRLEFVTFQLSKASPEAMLREINVMAPKELEEIWKWNCTTPAPFEKSISEIFSDRVKARPNGPAVCAWDGELSYGELNGLATIVACRLVKFGVGPEVLVPLCFEKSMWTTVAMLGVIMAGAAFVLLDPNVPEKRLEDIVKQLKASVILTSISQKALSSRLVQNVMLIDWDLSEFSNGSDQESPSLPYPNASSLIYVCFTSGSTGTPKGVMVTHRNVASAVYHQASRLRLSAGSRIFDAASYSFSATICNMFHAIFAGGCLCVPSDYDRRHRVPESITALRANVIEVTPSVSRLFKPEDAPTVELIYFSGEASSKRDFEQWWGGRVRIAHTYGNSECPFNSSINYEPQTPEDAISIGGAAGALTWIVDPENHNSLMPLGCIGELLLEGPIVSRGYLDNAAKTEVVYINDPPWLLQGSPGRPGRHGRLYRTGDLVKYTEDGRLIFIGRKDTQVKVRGQRVELGEVEYWLKKCVPEATNTAAEIIVPGGESSRPVLAAFIQLSDDESKNDHPTIAKAELNATEYVSILPTAAAVAEQIAEHLPSYMVPALLLSVPKLPTTVSGKLNRKRLREVGTSLSAMKLAGMQSAGRPKRQPASPSEECIQKIWSKVLDVQAEMIGADDNFLYLGGDSIAAMEVVRELRNSGFQLAVADVLRYPVLCDLAKQLHPLDELPAEIAPFSLLGDELDLTSFRRAIFSRYHLDPDIVVDAYPCTPLQQGLVSLTSKHAGDYIMQVVIELAPDVRVDDLCMAWERVARAMPLLRTRFIGHNELGLVQIVVQEDIEWIKAIGLDQYKNSDEHKSMELGEPLTRYALVEDDTGKTRWLVWTVHHGIFDGWSANLIVDAVQQAYLHQDSPISQGPQFQSFIKYIRDQDEEALMEYWRATMAGSNSTPFPERPRFTEEPVTYQLEDFKFPQLPRCAGITTSTLVRAAWALIVGRMTRQDDVVFGSTVSGRHAPVARVESIPAPTFATVPVRVRMPRNQGVSDFLLGVQQQSTDMIPFEQAGLHRIAKISPGCKNACMFQTLLLVQPQHNKGTEEVLGKWVWQDDQRPGFDTYALVLQVHLGVDSVMASASFDPSAIEPWEVGGLLRRLEYVMRQLSNTGSSLGDLCLAQVDVTTPQDLGEIWGWNKAVPEPAERCVDEMIEDMCRAHPASTAICAWDGELTYHELSRLAIILAGRLRAFGVGRNMVIPLCFEKSMWTTVSMLAVLKAGGAFVLLDTALPEERLRVIAQQVDANLILSSTTTQILSSRLCSEVLIICPELFSTLLQEPTSPLPKPDLDSYAYVIFTSGSTGTPKGVIIPHGSIATAMKYQAPLVCDENTRAYDFASYSFDVSVYLAFLVLTTGGCLCIPKDEDRKDSLAESMASFRVNATAITPSVLRTLSPEQVPGLDVIITGGELLNSKDVDPWWNKTRIVNVYGPAECTPTATMNLSPDFVAHNCRLGTAVGTVIWVVDPEDHGYLLAPGCVGELLIEGPLVGRGYLNDPDRTAAVFIQDPEWLIRGGPGHPGRRGRLYKTGDLVRYNKDGSLSFIGRKDAQVKIRGQRVELGEVEQHVLSCMRGVKQAAAEVISPGGEGAEPTLAAFVLMDATRTSAIRVMTASPEEEHELARLLPAYMLPTVYFVLDSLPLTTSGKLDRRRLRQLGEGFTAQQLAELRTGRASGSKRPPSTEVELALQQIWARVLKIDASGIGVDDSFLRLGGDSITAMQVSAAARECGIGVSTADLLKKKTISLVATITLISKQNGVKGGHAQPFQLSPAQQFYVKSQQSLFLKLRKPISLDSASQALTAIVSRHPMLRVRFSQKREGTWEQRISSNVADSFHLETGLARDDASHIRHCRDRIDAEKGPLVAAVLFGDADFQSLFIAISHLIVDEVSWRIILQELEVLLRGEQLEQLEPTMNFRDWCVQQPHYALAPSSYWGLEPRECAMTSKHFILDAESGQGLMSDCNRAFGTRPVELMVASLLHSFSLIFTDRPPPVTLVEGCGRDQNAHTIGCFTTLSSCAPASTTDLSDTIRRTKDLLRGDFVAGGPEVVFRYLDSPKLDGDLFTQLPTPDDDRPRVPMTPFEVEAYLDQGSLGITFRFPKHILQDRILTWIDEYQKTLTHTASLKHRPVEWTLSDFPLAFSSYDSIHEFQLLLPRNIDPQDVEDVFPCTPLQERFLAAQASDPRKYHIEIGLEITPSPVDPSRIEEAWRAVVQRHSLLRTLLISTPSGTMHVILKHPAVSIRSDGVMAPFWTANHSSTSNPVGYHKNGLQHTFSLRGSQMRLEMNHAICDGYSMDLLLHDFQLAYDAILLPPHAPSFKEYVRHSLTQPPITHSVEACLLAPSPGTGSGRFRLRASPDAPAVHNLCAAREVTIASVLQAAWAITLHAHTGLHSPSFGVLTSRRDTPGAEAIFGPLMSLNTCTINLDTERTVEEALKTLSEGAAIEGGTFNTAVSIERSAPTPPLSGDGHELRIVDYLDPVEWDVYVRADYSLSSINVVLEFWQERTCERVAADILRSFESAVRRITTTPEMSLCSLIQSSK